MDDIHASVEPRHAEFELKHDQENAESDTDSNGTDSHEHGRGNGGPFSTSKIEESDADSNEDDRELSAASKKESERDMVSSSCSSSDDVEIEREEVHNSSRDLPTGALDTNTFSEEEEKDEGTNAKEMQSHPEFEAFTTAEPSLPQNSSEFEAFTAETSLPVDEVEGSTDSAPDTSYVSNEQSLGGNAGAPISTPEEIDMQETRTRPKASAGENHKRPLPVDEVGSGPMKIATETAGDSTTHAFGDNAEEHASKPEVGNERDRSVEVQRSKAPIDQENKPSSSQSREISPETEELEEHSNHDPLETEDEYLKKGFTCGGNPEEDDEEQLREHWMRTLQTSTSTGEVVEEIVKVLKHHQKTHDLLCPVCGSCVTRRVILRKRKRSSLISVDRWYRDPLDEAETQELGSTLESTEAEEERATEEYQGPEAYGCLSCFSLFFENGRQLFNRLHAEAGSERFNCLPFFFPPYPWGMTQTRPQSPGMDEQAPREEVIEESEEPSSTVEGSTFSCGIGSALLPDYPWGTMPHLSKGENIQGSPVPETVEEQQPQVKESTCTCGLAQALIPEYSWGYLSKAEEAAPQSPRDMEAVAQPEISEEGPELPRERRDCTCGLVPALLPDYPWGFFRKDEGAHSIQTQTVEETEAKEAEDKRSSCDVVAAVLPSYPWGMMTESPDVPEDGLTRKSRLESLQNVGSAILPLYPWGVCAQEQTVQVDKKDEARIEEQVTSYIEQETTIEARITSTTDVYTVTSSKTTYPGEKPPQNIKNMVPNETSKTIKHVKLDQTVTIIDASVTLDEGAAIKGPPLVSLPSTGYALLEMMDEGSEKGRIESSSSTGYAYLEEISEEAESMGKDTPEKTKGSKVVFSPTVHESGGYKQESEIKEEIILQSVQGGKIHKHEKPKPNLQSQFPSFQWSVEQFDAGNLKSPFIKGSVEPEAETVISVLNPTPGVEKPKRQPWLSIFTLSKPSDEEGITAPLLSATGYMEEIEELKLPAGQPQTVIATEAVIEVPPPDLGGTTVGTGTSTAAAVAAIPKKEADGWDILKSIVYGGLDISIASLAVTSSAAGGNAITRTVVYMGLATLLSGLVGFYHNVLNLYHHHREHYINVVGVTLLLHGTVALVSFVIFGLLSPLLYALSYRKTDNRDDKFILCCGVTIVAVTLLSLGKAKVSNKRYIRTLGAYLLGGVLAAIIGYLTGEHVEELLEEWGL